MLPKVIRRRLRKVPLKRAVRGTAYALAIIALVSCSTILSFIVYGKYATISYIAPVTDKAVTIPTEFPVSVNPREKSIVENPLVEAYYREYLASKNGPTDTHTGWLTRFIGKLALMDWYQNLASLSSRILVVDSGERKEEVAQHFGKILGWSHAERTSFLATVDGTEPPVSDGKFVPGIYTVALGATPAEVAELTNARFREEVLKRYGDAAASVVPIGDALTIASLLEREAYDFTDMRQISGVIWNRLFVGMRLQIDATLQYARGNDPREPWWPRVNPRDKFIRSAYNTYTNEGLPPGPIANPSLAAILAALNPAKTSCMFYFHDARGDFYCSKTYEEHVSLLKQYYGRGK